MSAPTEPHSEHTETAEPKRPPILTSVGWILGGFAGGTTAAWAFWTVGDLIYRGRLDTPDAWWVLLLAAATAWVAFVIRCGQESIIRRQDRVIAFLSLMYDYHCDLGEKLDSYGDAREVRGHRLAAAVLHPAGNGRPLHVVD